MENLDEWFEEFLPKVCHHCGERCLREKEGEDGELRTVCRVPYNPPSPDCYYVENTYASMHCDAYRILKRYGVESTTIKGSFKYSASNQPVRITPQIPQKSWCFESNQNVMACDNKGNEHSYLIWYNLKGEQIPIWMRGQIGGVTEKNGRPVKQNQYFSSNR